MTPWHLRTVRVLATSIVVGAVACSTSSPGGGSTASTAPVLQGSYKAVTPGSIAEITFYEGDHYQLVDGVCANALLGGSSSSPSLASCNEEGNFALAATGATLILSPTSGAPRNLPFHSVLSGYVSSASTQSARRIPRPGRRRTRERRRLARPVPRGRAHEEWSPSHAGVHRGGAVSRVSGTERQRWSA